MKYLYRAKFADGSTLRQPPDDSSALRPGQKSSKFDYMEACKRSAPVSLTFTGDHEASYDFESRKFTLDGESVEPGCDLSRFGGDAEWVEGDPAQGHYFRQVIRDGFPPHNVLGVTFCFGDQPKPGVKNYLALR